MAGKGAIRDARSRCLTIPACADIHVPDSRVRGNDARRGSSGECHTRGYSARVEGSKGRRIFNKGTWDAYQRRFQDCLLPFPPSGVSFQLQTGTPQSVPALDTIEFSPSSQSPINLQPLSVLRRGGEATSPTCFVPLSTSFPRIASNCRRLPDGSTLLSGCLRPNANVAWNGSSGLRRAIGIGGMRS